MHRRSAAALAMGITAGTLLTGCVGSAVDQQGAAAQTTLPTASTRACTPGISTIYWGEAWDAGAVPVGSYLMEYAGPGEVATTTSIDLAVKPEFPGDGLKQLTEFDGDAIDEWHIALLADVRRTGQVDRTFGEPTQLAPTPPATMTAPAAGSWAAVVSMDRTVLPYEIECRGESTEGTVSSVDINNTHTAFFDCAALPDPATAESAIAAQTCTSA
jgi:hypothetical protein